MTSDRFKAMVVSEGPDKTFSRQIRQRSVSDLPPGDVLIRVRYSSLNYKDALSATGNRGVTRNYPHTPGIDAAGAVVESASPAFSEGDRVLVTGWDLGMNTAGGYGQMIRVPAEWVVPIPAGLDEKRAMALGTAGLTAAMSLYHLQGRGISPEGGPVLVTGASGGVGSLAVALLAKAGYEVAAVSGKPEAADFLKKLGAGTVLGRDAVEDNPGRPLLKGQWSGVVDTVGGPMLAAAIKSTRQSGTVTCCGNAASADLPLTVYPFILRGIGLLGIDSQNCPRETRSILWDKLAGPWRIDTLDALAETVALTELDPHIDAILAGRKQGRAVVDLDAA